jgi:hypothetical protein
MANTNIFALIEMHPTNLIKSHRILGLISPTYLRSRGERRNFSRENLKSANDGIYLDKQGVETGGVVQNNISFLTLLV